MSDFITGLGGRSPNPILSGVVTGTPGGEAIAVYHCDFAVSALSIFAPLTTRTGNRSSAAAYLRIAPLAALTFNRARLMFAAVDSLIQFVPSRFGLP